jgi:hypothetical protein
VDYLSFRGGRFRCRREHRDSLLNQVLEVRWITFDLVQQSEQLLRLRLHDVEEQSRLRARSNQLPMCAEI